LSLTMKFDKKYQTTAQHIELMKSRGLEIGDETFAAHWLEKSGYYRLTGYGLPFRKRCPNGELEDGFVEGAAFEDIVSIYEFDRHLRLLVLDAVERFEVAFRTCLNNTLALKYGPHWFIDRNLWSDKIDEKTGKPYFDHAEFLEAVNKDRQTPFIKKYRATYDDPEYPPCWMLAETMTLGTWSRAYGMLVNNQDKKPVSDAFHLSVGEMVSWSQTINDLRNKCAHQSRIWDARYVSGPRKKGYLKNIVGDNQCFFAQVAALIYCLWSVEPENSWLERLNVLLESCPLACLKTMGFPRDWKEKLLFLRESATGR